MKGLKIKKKYEQAISTLIKIEKKKIEDLISNEPKNCIIFNHFGHGNEQDFTTIETLLKSNQINYLNLEIFPGYPYGYLKLLDLENSIKFMNIIKKNMDQNYSLENNILLNYGNKQRNTFFFYTNVEYDNLSCIKNTNFINNAVENCDISGMTLIKDFITEKEEQEIFKNIESNKWEKLWNRKVQHYGYEFIYGANNINKNNKIGELPSWSNNIFKNEYKKYLSLDQLAINNYYPGDGIPPHFDTHSPFEEEFIALSMLGGITMNFKSLITGEEKNIYLPPRSLIIFSGEGRYAWQHGISTRKIDKLNNQVIFRKRRISLTFRKIKFDLCKCKYPNFCDSQNYDILNIKKLKNEFKNVNIMEKDKELEKSEKDEIMIKKEEIKNIEDEYVKKVYDNIAPHFSLTRYKTWPKVDKFLETIQDNSLVGDIGCGNGKYMINRNNLCMVGSDLSMNLIKIPKEKDFNIQVLGSNSLSLPYKNNLFDALISIAVIHHLYEPSKRLECVREMVRILKKNGKMLIYVWAFEQENRHFTEQDVFVPWNLQFKYEKNKTKDVIEEKNAKINENKQTVVYKRYYHLFKKNELDELCLKIPNIKIINSYYDHANWCIILEKI